MAGYESKEAMHAVLLRSFELMGEEPAFKQKAGKVRLTIGYDIDDIGLRFVVEVQDGVGRADFNARPEEAEFRMTLSSETYDRIFVGKKSPFRAMLTGDLKTSGNMLAARKLEPLLPTMIHAYRRAKLEALKAAAAEEAGEEIEAE